MVQFLILLRIHPGADWGGRVKGCRQAEEGPRQEVDIGWVFLFIYTKKMTGWKNSNIQIQVPPWASTGIEVTLDSSSPLARTEKVRLDANETPFHSQNPKAEKRSWLFPAKAYPEGIQPGLADSLTCLPVAGETGQEVNETSRPQEGRLLLHHAAKASGSHTALLLSCAP